MEGTLILSSNRGRYALSVDGEERSDLTSGQGLQIKLGGYWLSGCIEYDAIPIYATLGPQTLGEVAQMASNPKAIGGYYALIDGGGIVGLCVGMKVRI